MKTLIITSILLAIHFSSFCQPTAQQVTIKTRFLTVNDNFSKEIGINFQAGLNLAHQTNTPTENRVPKAGINLGASVEGEPWNGLFIAPGLEFSQTGLKYKTEDFVNTATRNNIGINLTVNPRIDIEKRPIEVGLVVEPALSFTIGELVKTKSNGNVDKQKVEFDDQDRRVEGIIRTGVSTTLNTDLGDFSISLLYAFGLTNIYKDAEPPVKNQVFSINFIGKLFTKRDAARDRNKELLIFLTPRLIEAEDGE